MTFEELYETILDRKKNLPEGSYVASLFKEGRDRIIQKMGEESVEAIIAAKNKGKKRIVSEIADLWFHSLILLAECGIKPTEILSELESRRKPQKPKN